MTMVKSIASHINCVYHIQDYLEKNNRAIARDFLNFPTDRDHTRNWSYFFDKTRADYGNAGKYAGKDPVTYQQFIVSPDPRDNIDIDRLREFVKEWAIDSFGGGEGSIGRFEVAIVYHDDNQRGIMHAHVVVNSTDLDTGNRLQIKNKQNKYLASHLQELAVKHGLTAFASPDAGAQLEPTLKVKRTAAEVSIRKERKFSWKQELRNVADIAVRTSANVPQFLAACAAYGVDVRQSARDANDYIYVHPANPKRWRCSGKQLGESYTPRTIAERIEQVRPKVAALRSKLRPNVLEAAPEAQRESVKKITREDLAKMPPEEAMKVRIAIVRELQRMLEGAETVAVVDRSVRIDQVASTLRTVERFGIECQADFTREMQGVKRSEAIAKKQGKLDPELKASLDSQYARLAAAKRVAEKSSMFKGIADVGPKPSPQAPPRTAGNAHAPGNGRRAGGGAGRASQHKRGSMTLGSGKKKKSDSRSSDNRKTNRGR